MKITNEQNALEAQRAYDEKYRESRANAIATAKKGIIPIEPGHGTVKLLIDAASKAGVKNLLVITMTVNTDFWRRDAEQENKTIHILSGKRTGTLAYDVEQLMLDDASKDLVSNAPKDNGDPVIWLATSNQVPEICDLCQFYASAVFDGIVATDARDFLSVSSKRSKAMRFMIDNRADFAIGVTGPGIMYNNDIGKMQAFWGNIIKADNSWMPEHTEPTSDSDGAQDSNIIEARENPQGPDSVLFEVTPGHVALFKRLNMYPAFGVNDMTQKLDVCAQVSWKKPFGNSSGLYDACGILGYVKSDGSVTPKDEKKAMFTMIGLPVAIQCFAISGQISPGIYRTDEYGAWFHYRNLCMAVFWKEAIEACAKMGLAADRAADFAANTPARNGNPYSLLSDLKECASGSKECLRILKVFEDEAIRRYDAAYDMHEHDREAILNSLISGTVGLSWQDWPLKV